jgi:hypothetical protein
MFNLNLSTDNQNFLENNLQVIQSGNNDEIISFLDNKETLILLLHFNHRHIFNKILLKIGRIPLLKIFFNHLISELQAENFDAKQSTFVQALLERSPLFGPERHEFTLQLFMEGLEAKTYRNGLHYLILSCKINPANLINVLREIVSPTIDASNYSLSYLYYALLQQDINGDTPLHLLLRDESYYYKEFGPLLFFTFFTFEPYLYTLIKDYNHLFDIKYRIEGHPILVQISLLKNRKGQTLFDYIRSDYSTFYSFVIMMMSDESIEELFKTTLESDWKWLNQILYLNGSARNKILKAAQNSPSIHQALYLNKSALQVVINQCYQQTPASTFFYPFVYQFLLSHTSETELTISVIQDAENKVRFVKRANDEGISLEQATEYLFDISAKVRDADDLRHHLQFTLKSVMRQLLGKPPVLCYFANDLAEFLFSERYRKCKMLDTQTLSNLFMLLVTEINNNAASDDTFKAALEKVQANHKHPTIDLDLSAADIFFNKIIQKYLFPSPTSNLKTNDALLEFEEALESKFYSTLIRLVLKPVVDPQFGEMPLYQCWLKYTKNSQHFDYLLSIMPMDIATRIESQNLSKTTYQAALDSNNESASKSILTPSLERHYNMSKSPSNSSMDLDDLSDSEFPNKDIGLR